MIFFERYIVNQIITIILYFFFKNLIVQNRKEREKGFQTSDQQDIVITYTSYNIQYTQHFLYLIYIKI